MQTTAQRIFTNGSRPAVPGKAAHGWRPRIWRKYR